MNTTLQPMEAVMKKSLLEYLKTSNNVDSYLAHARMGDNAVVRVAKENNVSLEAFIEPEDISAADYDFNVACENIDLLTASMEGVQDLLEIVRGHAPGQLTSTESTLVQVALNGHRASLGVMPAAVSMESFTVVSMEGRVMDFFRALWAAIKKAIISAYNAVMNYFKAVSVNAEKIKTKAEELKAKVEKLGPHDKPKRPNFVFEKLHILEKDGRYIPNDIVDTLVATDMLLENIEAAMVKFSGVLTDALTKKDSKAVGELFVDSAADNFMKSPFASLGLSNATNEGPYHYLGTHPLNGNKVIHVHWKEAEGMAKATPGERMKLIRAMFNSLGAEVTDGPSGNRSAQGDGLITLDADGMKMTLDWVLKLSARLIASQHTADTFKKAIDEVFRQGDEMVSFITKSESDMAKDIDATIPPEELKELAHVTLDGMKDMTRTMQQLMAVTIKYLYTLNSTLLEYAEKSYEQYA
jgi:hypothetical protein